VTSHSFKDCVVPVTGAGSGLGQASALAFARAGAKVAVVDIHGSGDETRAQSMLPVDGGWTV
jgi:NAD(P)-dependent dehydrogenase (short-subunit alcohol dehydrogenase family)